jgi:hypothetical protein
MRFLNYLNEFTLPPADTQMDPRSGSSVKERWDRQRQDVKQFLDHTIGVYADVRQGNYRCVILKNDRMLYFDMAEHPDVPVPSGIWMHQWEKALGVSEAEWQKLSMEKRAQLEANLQLKSWIKSEIHWLMAEFYFPTEHGEWWHDVAAKQKEFGTSKGFYSYDPYWKKILKGRK